MSSPFPKICEFLTSDALGPPLALISSPLESYFHTSHLHLSLLLSLPDIVNFTKEGEVREKLHIPVMFNRRLNRTLSLFCLRSQ